MACETLITKEKGKSDFLRITDCENTPDKTLLPYCIGNIAFETITSLARFKS